jgi:hypothetical protein
MAAFMPEPDAGAAHNKLTSQHTVAGCENNVRDASRIPSGPGLPASFGAKQLETSGDHGFFPEPASNRKRLRAQNRLPDLCIIQSRLHI